MMCLDVEFATWLQTPLRIASPGTMGSLGRFVSDRVPLIPHAAPIKVWQQGIKVNEWLI